MKMHKTVIDKVMNLFHNYGGHADETKLKKMLSELDFTIYTQKSGKQETIVVLTEDYQRESAGTKRF